MGGESGRKSVLIGLAFLLFAAGIVVWTYASRQTSRRAEISSPSTAGTDGSSTPDADVAGQAGQSSDSKAKPPK